MVAKILIEKTGVDKNTYPILPTPGYAQLRIFNGIPECRYKFKTNFKDDSIFNISGIDYYERKYVPTINGTFRLRYSITAVDEDCPFFFPGFFDLHEAMAYGLFLQPQQPILSLKWYIDEVEKSKRGNPLVRTLANLNERKEIIWRTMKNGGVESKQNATHSNLIELRAEEYEVLVDGVSVFQHQLRHGGVYALIIGSDTQVTISKIFEVTAPNSMSMLWLIPQYVMMTLGEVMFSVTGLEFSYSQAPMTMKTVVQACWLLTVAFGNVIVVIVAEVKIFDSQASEFFLFAGLMFVDMVIFMWTAFNYKPNDPIQFALKANVDSDMEQVEKEPRYKLRPMEDF